MNINAYLLEKKSQQNLQKPIPHVFVPFKQRGVNTAALFNRVHADRSQNTLSTVISDLITSWYC